MTWGQAGVVNKKTQFFFSAGHRLRGGGDRGARRPRRGVARSGA